MVVFALTLQSYDKSSKVPNLLMEELSAFPFATQGRRDICYFHLMEVVAKLQVEKWKRQEILGHSSRHTQVPPDYLA